MKLIKRPFSKPAAALPCTVQLRGDTTSIRESSNELAGRVSECTPGMGAD